MSGLDLLSSLLPLAGSGASGFMEGQQQAIAANQAKQAMYLAEQEERRKQALFPKQIRALDTTEKAQQTNIELASLGLRPNVADLNPQISELLGGKPEDFQQMTEPEQVSALLKGKGIAAAGNSRGQSDWMRGVIELLKSGDPVVDDMQATVNELDRQLRAKDALIARASSTKAKQLKSERQQIYLQYLDAVAKLDAAKGSRGKAKSTAASAIGKHTGVNIPSSLYDTEDEEDIFGSPY